MGKLFKKSCKKIMSFIGLLFLMPINSQAQALQELVLGSDPVLLVILGLLIFVVLILAYLIHALKIFLYTARPEAKKATLLSGVIKKLTDTVPIEEEDVILTDHVYDGIQELDNNLPPWWKYMFYATIVFSFVYIYYYHFGGSGKSQLQEYEHELILAEAQKQQFSKNSENAIDENNVTALSAPEALANGKEMFVQYCAACHGKAGEGGVGPNLTDEYWLHGGGIQNVFKSVKYGIPQKGMIAWQTQLSAASIQEISSFILSLEGTNPPNGKAPQGDKYEEKKDSAEK